VKLKTRVLGENHSSRKGSPCSCENYHFDGRPLIQFLEKLRQPGEHIPGEGIQSFRSVESDNGNSTAAYFKLYLILSLFCHGIDKLLLPLRSLRNPASYRPSSQKPKFSFLLLREMLSTGCLKDLRMLPDDFPNWVSPASHLASPKTLPKHTY
jgi:hypothetical protein